MSWLAFYHLPFRDDRLPPSPQCSDGRFFTVCPIRVGDSEPLQHDHATRSPHRGSMPLLRGRLSSHHSVPQRFVGISPSVSNNRKQFLAFKCASGLFARRCSCTHFFVCTSFFMLLCLYSESCLPRSSLPRSLQRVRSALAAFAFSPQPVLCGRLFETQPPPFPSWVFPVCSPDSSLAMVGNYSCTAALSPMTFGGAPSCLVSLNILGALSTQAGQYITLTFDKVRGDLFFWFLISYMHAWL